MNIYDYALKMEQEGETLYRSLAERASPLRLKLILGLLAEEEVKHRDVIQGLKERDKKGGEANDHGLNTIKTVFQRFSNDLAGGDSRETKESLSQEDSELASYRNVAKIEENARDFYHSKSLESGSPHHSAVFQKLASEEDEHRILMLDIVALIDELDGGPET